MTQIEALTLALEALEEINKLSVGENAICLPAEIDTAMDAIKEALAQPEQEPVVHDPLPRACNLAGVDYQTFLKIKAYMPVAPPQPEQEPVAILNHAHGVHTFRNVNLKGLPDGEYLFYTHPPQRTEQEPICPDCKAKVLYECVACSSNNYPPKENA